MNKAKKISVEFLFPEVNSVLSIIIHDLEYERNSLLSKTNS